MKIDLSYKPYNLGETHKWADHVELSTLVQADRTVSLEGIAKMLDADVGDTLEAISLLGNIADADSVALGDVTLERVEDDQLEDGENTPTFSPLEHSNPNESNASRRRRTARRQRLERQARAVRPVDAASRADKRRLLAADLISILRWRADSFGADYPFILEDDGPETFAIRRRDSLGDRQRLYLFLLLAGSLPVLVDKSDESALTYPFERLTAIALKAQFPNAEVEVFGTSSQNPDLPSTKREKIQYLADRLKGRIGPDVEYLSDDDKGDSGLDVYVQVNFGDEQDGRLVLFAQAACSSEQWKTKQASVTPSAWNRKLHLDTPQVPVCAVPFSFRRAGGDWHDTTIMSDVILLDRSRLMHMLREAFTDLDPVDTPDGRGKDLLEQVIEMSVAR